jgi:hypothetical protein
MIRAVQHHMRDMPMHPSDSALKYFSNDPNERKKVVSLLTQHGITPVEFQAKAAQLNSEPLQMFERTITARENGRRKLRKEAKRRAGPQETEQGSGNK